MSRHFSLQTNLVPALIVFAVAFIVRIIFLNQFAGTLLFANHVVDMAFHHEWASAIANGQTFYDGPFFRAPLYPLMLGMIYKLISAAPEVIRMIQLFVGALNCVIIFLIGTKLFSRKVGMIAGILMALYGPMIFFEAQLLSVSFTIFFYFFGFYVLLLALERKTYHFYILSGVIYGLGAITRPNILLFIILAVVWLMVLIYAKRTTLDFKNLLFFICANVIIILPITITNFVKSGDVILIGSYGGINAYIGNYRGADGVSAIIPGVRQDWWGGFEDTRRIAQQETGMILTDQEISTFWYQKTLGEIFKDPGHFFELLGKKIVLLMEGNELSNNFDFYYFARQPAVTKYLISPSYVYFPWGIIFPLAIAGLFFLKPISKEKKLLLIYLFTMAFSILLFLISARYRMILVPPVVLLAAVAIDGFQTKFSSMSVVRKAIILKLLIISLVVANTDIWGYADRSYAHGYHTSATIYNRNGNARLAEENYLRAIKADPNQTETLNDLALLYDRQDNPVKGIPLLQKAVNLPNATFLNKYNLAYLYLRVEQPDNAIPVLKQVVNEAPDYLYGYNNLGLAYLQVGEFDSSLATYRQLRQREPDFPAAFYNMGYCFLALDMPDSATAYFQRYLTMIPTRSPDYPEIRHLLDSLTSVKQ